MSLTSSQLRSLSAHSAKGTKFKDIKWIPQLHGKDALDARKYYETLADKYPNVSKISSVKVPSISSVKVPSIEKAAKGGYIKKYAKGGGVLRRAK